MLFTIIGGLIGLVISIFYIMCFWKLFKKAGKPGWFSILPIFNIIMFYIITKTIIFLPIVLVMSIIFAIVSNIVGDIFVILSIICLVIMGICGIICWFKIFKAYGKGILFAILSIPFGFITLPIMAFGNSEYIYNNGEIQSKSIKQPKNNKSIQQPQQNIDFQEDNDIQIEEPVNKLPSKKKPIQQNINTQPTNNEIENDNFVIDNQSREEQENNEFFMENEENSDNINIENDNDSQSEEMNFEDDTTISEDETAPFIDDDNTQIEDHFEEQETEPMSTDEGINLEDNLDEDDDFFFDDEDNDSDKEEL